MEIKNFDSAEMLDFIHSNIKANTSDLLMKFDKKPLSFDLRFAITQIINRNKSRKKIPRFLSFNNFLFPDLISAEQASDERVSHFHAFLIGKKKFVIDLTAGLGIDAMTIAANGNVVIAVEQDKNKANVLLHNANVLELSDFKVVNDDCINFLESLRSCPDYFFIDPARRDNANKRTYALSECTPDVTSIYRKLIEKGSTLYIKASPLLDVTAILHQLESVSEIFIISVKNECKEVLIKMEQGKVWPPRLTAIDLDDEGIKSSFSFEEDNSNEKKKVSPTIASIEEIRKDTFLYEPNAALMKLNAGKQICKHYECLKKASANTELFLSNDFIEKFPGRVIKIERFLTSKDLKGVKGKGYSVATRNYPMKAEDLKKKLGVKENPENFIYAFRVGVAGKPVIIEGKRMEAKG